MEENSVQPVVTESKRKLVFLFVFVTFLIIALGIIGFLAYQNHQLQQKIAQTSATLSPLPTIALTAVPTVVAGQTVGWKTFNRNGMLFKYPQEWVINTSSDIISSRVPPITLVAVPKDRTLMNECMDMISTSMVSDVVVKKFARVSAGEMCTTDDTSSRQIWVVESEDSYSPGLSYQYSAQDSVSAEKIFDQILSTFKFTEEEVSTDPETHKGWTTYTDKDAKFLIQYPQGWILRKTYGASVNNTGNYRVSGVDISTNLSTGSTVVVNIIDPKNETFENWVKLHSGETNVPNAVNSSFKNIPAYRFERFREGRPAEVVTYYALPNNSIVFLALNPSLADQAVGELILSSFKFTN